MFESLTFYSIYMYHYVHVHLNLRKYSQTSMARTSLDNENLFKIWFSRDHNDRSGANGYDLGMSFQYSI